VIMARPRPPVTGPLLRLIFLSGDHETTAVYQAWATGLGVAAVTMTGPVGRAAAALAGPGRLAPTVLVAAGVMAGPALALCRGDCPPDRLIVLPGPAAGPPPEDPPGTPLTVLACSPGNSAEAALLTRWRRASRGPVTIRLLPPEPGLLAPGSPVPFLVAEMFRFSPRWIPAAPGASGPGGPAPGAAGVAETVLGGAVAPS